MTRIVDYYHQNVCLGVVLRLAERIKTCDLKQLGYFKKISELLGFDGEYPAVHRNSKFCRLC